jgi:hypothetical protein
MQPYGFPPQLPASPPPPPPRPPVKTPRTFGILSLVFGGILTLQSLTGLVAGQAMMSAPGLGRTMDQVYGPGVIERYMERIRPATRAQSSLFLVMSLALVGIGIGQLGYRRWARRASIAWGIAGLVALVPLLYVYLTIMGPAQAELMTAISSRQVAQMQPLFSQIGRAMSGMTAVMTLVYYAPYPTILIFVFRRPRVVEAMTR